MSHHRAFFVGALAVLVTSCATFRAPDPEEAGGCYRHRLTKLPRLTSQSVLDLAGRYELIMVARSGDLAGRVARGEIVLARSDSTQRSLGLGPLAGSTHIDIAEVSPRAGSAGIQRGGGQPPLGTYFDEARNDFEIILEPQRSEFDGDKQRVISVGTQLQLERIADGTLTGSWKSGAFTQDATGYFCATRLDR
jgi:hypothetical protein